MSEQSISQLIESYVWQEYIWLPSNMTWKQFYDTPYRHAKFTDLQVALLFAVFFCCVQYILEQFFLTKLGRYLGIEIELLSEKDPRLQKVFKKTPSPDMAKIRELATEIKWSVGRVQKWFAMKRRGGAHTLQKFRQCSYRLIYYIPMFIYETYVLHDEPFFIDGRLAIGYETWPKHDLKDQFYWVYIIEIGYYCSQLFAILGDRQRRDFSVIAIHHVSAILLTSFSYVSGFFQIGILILWVHNIADIVVEYVKAYSYVPLHRERTLHILFGGLWVVWIATRLGLFTAYLVYPSTLFVYERYSEGTIWPSLVLMYSCLVAIQMVHYIYTFFISLTVRNLIQGHKRDWRSDASDDEKND